jgi:hypothetical protein
LTPEEINNNGRQYLNAIGGKVMKKIKQCPKCGYEGSMECIRGYWGYWGKMHLS